MNEVSIIINGVRYDAADIGHTDCVKECELPITICESCGNLYLQRHIHFFYITNVLIGRQDM